MPKYELEIEIRPDDVDKRQKLAARIDMTLALTGCRITAGEYTVIIERKTARQLRAEAKAEAEAGAAAPKASSDGEEEPNACPRCGKWWCARATGCNGTVEGATP